MDPVPRALGGLSKGGALRFTPFDQAVAISIHRRPLIGAENGCGLIVHHKPEAPETGNEQPRQPRIPTLPSVRSSHDVVDCSPRGGRLINPRTRDDKGSVFYPATFNRNQHPS